MSVSLLRKKINALDQQIIKLLQQRTVVVKDIAREKKKLNIPIRQPAREREILQRISSSAIRRIYKTILQESQRVQRK